MPETNAVILEFDNETRPVIRDALREHGFLPRYFSSANDIENHWQDVRQASFFVIAGDVPGDGLSILKRVRKEASAPDAPVLFILEDKSEERVHAVIAEKPNAVLLRPFTVKDVTTRIEALAQGTA